MEERHDRSAGAWDGSSSFGKKHEPNPPANVNKPPLLIVMVM